MSDANRMMPTTTGQARRVLPLAWGDGDDGSDDGEDLAPFGFIDVVIWEMWESAYTVKRRHGCLSSGRFKSVMTRVGCSGVKLKQLMDSRLPRRGGFEGPP